MIRITDKSACTGCTACESICSHNAIVMKFDDRGHRYPVVDESICVNCGLCEKVCPMLHQNVYDLTNENLPIFAVYNRDIEIRKRSTSGGFFTLISNYVIQHDGVVYAARFDSSFKIIHDSANRESELDVFRGSKYAQSDLTGVFRSIKKDLKNKLVLFVGTPCQVAGLKSFLRKEYKNLITCDFICMGISSPQIWDEYLDAFWNRTEIKNIKFKDKRSGWHKFKMLIEDKDGEHLIETMKDPFFSCYLTHLTYRESCFSCPFRHISRVSDFTIGDCWGIDKYQADFDDDKGCTTLILQSKKAIDIFECIKSKLEFIPFPLEMIKCNNPYAVSAISRDPDSDLFYLVRAAKGIIPAFEAVKKQREKRGKKQFVFKVFHKIKKILWR